MTSKVLVGTDGSATASLAVDRAVAMAQAAGATLTILAVGPAGVADGIVARESERVAAAGLQIDTRTASGEPSRALVEEARKGGYDLLVVGNRGMTGPSRFLRLGSVPSRVMHRLPCSLLVVKTT